MIFDLFCGGGGFSAGAAAAGHAVLWACDSWQVAIDTHARNHPQAVHACEDLTRFNYADLGTCDMLLASPPCQGHSRGRGADKPRHVLGRRVAFSVVDAIAATRPQVAIIENVPGFLQWREYREWRSRLKSLGYSASPHIYDAADFGIPQRRKRVFILVTRSSSMIFLDIEKMPHMPAREVVDLDRGTWSPIDVKGRVARTAARIKQAREDFGDTFLLPFYPAARTGRSLDRPFGTFTCSGKYAIVHGDNMRMRTVEKVRRGMGSPSGYHLPTSTKDALRVLGNAVVPNVASRIIEEINASR